MRETYKTPLTINEQVNHIKSQKRVIFKNISESEACTILYEHNYINLITPFKLRFADTKKDGTPKRDVNHNHIYSKDTEFSDYYSAYLEERVKYPIIFSNIMRFETIFSSILSYETIHYYSLNTYTNFIDFITFLKTNALILSANQTYSRLQIDNMQKEINEFDKEMSLYEDIYIFFDRLSLSELITVFRCLDPELKSKVFKTLLNANAVLGYKTFTSFDEILTRIVPIRNCICHSNSLEILTNYLKIKQKVLRTSTDRKKYKNLIKRLSLE